MAQVLICGREGADRLAEAFSARGCAVTTTLQPPRAGELAVAPDVVVFAFGVDGLTGAFDCARALVADRPPSLLVAALFPPELARVAHSLLSWGVDEVATEAAELVDRVLARILCFERSARAHPPLLELALQTGGSLELETIARATLLQLRRCGTNALPSLGLAALDADGERDRHFRLAGERLETLAEPLPPELQQALTGSALEVFGRDGELPVVLRARLDETGAGCAISIPLVSNGVRVGAVGLLIERRPDDEQLELLRALCALCAAAAHNALLHGRNERRRVALESAYHGRYRELLETNRRLRELNHLKDEFLAICAHDLRSPLNVMLGHGRLLLDGMKGPLTPAAQQAVESINRQARRILELVEELLDLRAIETGRLELKRRDVDLTELVNETCDELQLVAREQNVVLARSVPEAPLPLYVDATRIREVLMNLLSNALKFTPSGGRVEVKLSATEGGARLAVQDTGPGIPADELPHLFERYRRGREGRAQGRGTGLGLAICREIVELHGGTIVAESEPGHGTRFALQLPNGLAEKSASARRTRSRPLILLVEDDRDSSEIIAELLAVEYEVLRASDGEEGVRLARERTPDMILLDIFLPRLDGFAAMEDLRRDPRTGECPIIMLSAQDDDLTKVRGLNLGAADYLAKPFSGRELLARVEKTLKATQQRRALRALAETDALTNLPNFRAFHARLEEEFKRARRYHTPLACVMVDLDNLKYVNDRFGHASGNRAIALAAETIAAELRETDFAARYGGDEFVVLLPHANEQEASVFAERVRERIASRELVLDGERVGLRASIGVAASQGGEQDSPEDLWRRADGALYSAKKGGRNCVVRASGPRVEPVATATQ